MADHHEGEHKHGSMDIRAQEKTFEGFVRMSVWVVCISIAVLIFMALVNA
ncbi:aa3-type cytochrome c oxidase subunit IV [Tabrizicola sp.]